jgi:hypothetical protein
MNVVTLLMVALLIAILIGAFHIGDSRKCIVVFDVSINHMTELLL